MPWIIKLEDMFVKNGKQDTDNVAEAKKFNSVKQAKTFAQTNLDGMPYEIIEHHEVSDGSK